MGGEFLIALSHASEPRDEGTFRNEIFMSDTIGSRRCWNVVSIIAGESYISRIIIRRGLFVYAISSREYSSTAVSGLDSTR